MQAGEFRREGKIGRGKKCGMDAALSAWFVQNRKCADRRKKAAGTYHVPYPLSSTGYLNGINPLPMSFLFCFSARTFFSWANRQMRRFPLQTELYRPTET